MKVKEIMNSDIKTANPNTSVARVIELLQRYRINSIIVVNDDDKLEGIQSKPAGNGANVRVCFFIGFLSF